MKELRTIVKAWETIDFSETRAALATVVRVEGSSYRRMGARMLVLDNGTFLGGISGGCLEGDALRRAQKAIALDRPSLVTYDTTQDDDHQIGVGLGCNGVIDVLFTPLNPEAPENPVRILTGLTGIREPVVLVTITGCPAGWDILGKAILYRDDEQFREAFSIGEITEDVVEKLTGEVLKDIRESRNAYASRSVTYQADGMGEPAEARGQTGELKLFIEVILPATRVVVYGGGYDIHPLIRMAAELGWDTIVVMNITKAGKPLLAAATKVLHNRGEIQPEIDPYTAVLLMSHDYKTDFANLARALPSRASYIGLLGPRKRAEKIFAELAETGRGLSDADRQRIYAPTGLDIGASTPEEIALSILAEIRSHFAGRQGMGLRSREGSIYERPE